MVFGTEAVTCESLSHGFGDRWKFSVNFSRCWMQMKQVGLKL